MPKIIIKESELIKLIETAMDLDRYIEPVSYDTGDENENLSDSIDVIVNRLKELLFMLKSGKKINYQNKSEFFSELDRLNSLYDKIKYED
jgi:hypothetical protein